jgi:adenylate cyclase
LTADSTSLPPPLATESQSAHAVWVGEEQRDGADDGDAPPKLTFLQRRGLKQIVKQARKRPGEPLSPEDWEAYWRFAAQPSTRAFKRVLRLLPSTPRCGYCGAPFAGLGGRIVRPLGYRPSRKNPNLCSTCVELAPPGGVTLEIGVLFADLRGFTSDSEQRSSLETSQELRRFYAHAERVFFPEALIDKLIGDEVMALYVPPFVDADSWQVDDDIRHRIATTMIGDARALLERVGYGSAGEPEFAIGIGVDFGEAFIGNIGDSAVHDFTAVGDVVNTAARLQSHADSGEVVVSERVAMWLDDPPGEPDRLALKGKVEPVDVRRVRFFPIRAAGLTERH